jgi:hypothetical protein
LTSRTKNNCTGSQVPVITSITMYLKKMPLNRTCFIITIAVVLFINITQANEVNCRSLYLKVINISKENKTVFCSKIHAEAYFTYKYTHSLQKLPIEEKFRVRSDRTFELVDSKVLSLASAGLFPSPQESLHNENEYIHVRTSRIFKSVQIRATYYYNQYLILNNKILNISENVTPGDLLEITIY